MNLQWNHWAALASVLGEMTAQGTGRVESSMKSSSNPGTMGRPKSAHILSQLSPPAHPSNPQWTVSPLNSPGTTYIPCLLLLFSPAYTGSPFYPHSFFLFLLPFTVTCLVFSRGEYCGQRGNKPGGCFWLFSSIIKETHQKICLGRTDVKITHVSPRNHSAQCFRWTLQRMAY